MKILVLYLVYVWVGLLHTFFVGTCLYAWGHKWLAGKAKVWAFIIAFLVLAFFETYWIPVFNYFGLQVSSSDATVQHTFGISATENIVRNLSPRWWNMLFWIVQASLAVWIYQRLLRKKE